jgi:hypothetical protein
MKTKLTAIIATLTLTAGLALAGTGVPLWVNTNTWDCLPPRSDGGTNNWSSMGQSVTGTVDKAGDFDQFTNLGGSSNQVYKSNGDGTGDWKNETAAAWPVFVVAESLTNLVVDSAAACHVNFDRELADAGGNFASPYFTAPTNGWYDCRTTFFVTGDAGYNVVYGGFWTNSTAIVGVRNAVSATEDTPASTHYAGYCVSALIFIEAGSTLRVMVDGASDEQYTVYGNVSNGLWRARLQIQGPIR